MLYVDFVLQVKNAVGKDSDWCVWSFAATKLGGRDLYGSGHLVVMHEVHTNRMTATASWKNYGFTEHVLWESAVPVLITSK